MKFSLCTVFALSGLLATTLANPVPTETTLQKRQDIDQQAGQLDDLQSTIEELTTKINETMKEVPDDVSDDKADSIRKDLDPILEALKDALAKAAKEMDAAQSSSSDKKRSTITIAARSCDDKCLAGKSNKLVTEVSSTLRVVVVKLGPDRVLGMVKPVLAEIKTVLGCLDKTVKGLLKIGSGLLGSILGGCGIDSLLGDLLGGVLGEGALGDILGGGDLGSILEGVLGDDGLLGGLLGGDDGLLGGLLGGGDDDDGDDDDGGLIGGILGRKN